MSLQRSLKGSRPNLLEFTETSSSVPALSIVSAFSLATTSEIGMMCVMVGFAG